MAGLATEVPGYMWLTERKVGLFIVAGILLTLAIISKYIARNAPCPIDPKQAKACMRMRKMGTVILSVAVVFYLIGGFFAFFAADLLL